MQVETLKIESGLKDKVYDALKRAIVAMDIYAGEQPPKLDERYLATQLGVSRTPVREALMRLEHEGLVSMVPRRGAFVLRKSRAEIVETIQVWAGLEGMAARLAAHRASDAELTLLRREFVTVDDAGSLSDPNDGAALAASANIDEYSEQNIKFHQRIVQLSRSTMLSHMMDGLFLQMQFIRRRSVRDAKRTARSVSDHILIIEALQTREAERAHELVVGHALSLAEHVQQHVDYLQ